VQVWLWAAHDMWALIADIVLIQLNARQQLNFKITFIKPLVLNNRTFKSQRMMAAQ